MVSVGMEVASGIGGVNVETDGDMTLEEEVGGGVENSDGALESNSMSLDVAMGSCTSRGKIDARDGIGGTVGLAVELDGTG